MMIKLGTCHKVTGRGGGDLKLRAENDVTLPVGLDYFFVFVVYFLMTLPFGGLKR
jgi:hypothetical protein